MPGGIVMNKANEDLALAELAVCGNLKFQWRVIEEGTWRPSEVAVWGRAMHCLCVCLTFHCRELGSRG